MIPPMSVWTDKDWADYEAACDAAPCCGSGQGTGAEPCEDCKARDAYEVARAELESKCRKVQFLDDPITEAYGVGAEMVGLIKCDCQLCMELADL